MASGVIGNLTIRLFLGIYNCEVNRAQMVLMILQDAELKNSSDMVFHILGQIGTSITMQNLMFDLCLVLQSMHIPQYDTLRDRVENYTKDRESAGSLMLCVEWPRQCRVSLRQVLKTMRHTDKAVVTQQPANTSDYIPPDMPLQPANWATKSSTEQQITLLIICIQTGYIEAKSVFITSLFGNIVTADIDDYTVKHHRIQAIITVTLPLLHKINNNIDLTNDKLVILINHFVEECFNGIFGTVHRTLMTLSFFTQMYIIAYLETPMRLKFYQHTVATFNRRLEADNKELTISCNMPHNLIANMDYWAKKNSFSTTDLFAIFKTMCV